MAHEFLQRHWHHLLGGGGGLWFLGRLIGRFLERQRDKRDRKRYDRGLRELKWSQQRERLRVERWRDELGKLDDGDA